MATTTTDPLVGHLVDGRYEVTSRIARGGMATVYLALDKRLDRHVALKVMHAHLAEGPGGPQFIARFRREARSAARLTHPAIVAVYDQGIDGDVNYLAMEYVPGTTLRHSLHDDGPYPLSRTFDVLEAVCEALATAHRVGVVHRDVKPENVLIDTEGRLRIADFGLARAIDEVTATSTGTVLGTVAYLAPELIAQGTCDARTDVYAVGIMAYEMVTGAVPHSGHTPIQVAYQHVNADVRPPSDLLPDLPAEVDRLVCALAARNPAERPADAAAALALVRQTRAAIAPADLDRSWASPPAAGAEQGTVRAATGRLAGASTLAATGHLDAARVPATAARRGPTTTDPATADPTAADPATADPGATDLIDFRPGRPPVAAADPDENAPTPDPPDSSNDETARRSPGRRRLPWLIVAGVVLLAAVAAGVWWWNASGPGAYTSVPQGLVGVRQSAAEHALDEANLAYTSERQYHDSVPAGAIVSTDPAAGERIRKDGSVHLVVSRGVQMLTMPGGLVGQSADQATTALKAEGFTLTDPKNEYSDTVPAGQVLAVSGPDGSIAQGTSLPHSTPITLTVSGGPEPIVVQDVTNKPEADAVAALEAQGLEVTTSQENSETVPQGEVISQVPAAGTNAHRTDAAALVISAGPPMVDLPSYFGKNVKDAQKELEAAGFQVTVEYPQKLHPFNQVYGQSPDGGKGKQAPKGSTVTLQVF